MDRELSHEECRQIALDAAQEAGWVMDEVEHWSVFLTLKYGRWTLRARVEVTELWAWVRTLDGTKRRDVLEMMTPQPWEDLAGDLKELVRRATPSYWMDEF